MTLPEPESFPPGVALKLKTYVYRLIDPRNGETFYVGKGKGNRVFAHIHAEASLDGDEIDNKLKRIRDIRLAGFEVILATMQGVIVGAFVAHDWLAATAENFPGRAQGEGAPGRYGFIGEEAPEDMKKLYVEKRVPDEYRKRGAANRIKYTWKK